MTNELNIGCGSVLRILSAVQGEVCADIAETRDPLPPFVKARMVKAHRFADDRDQGVRLLSIVVERWLRVALRKLGLCFDSAARRAKRRIHQTRRSVEPRRVTGRR